MVAGMACNGAVIGSSAFRELNKWIDKPIL